MLGFQDKNEMKLDIGRHGHRPTARANATVTPWTIDTTTTLYCEGLEYILDATRASKEYSIELEIFGHQNGVAHRDERTG